MQFFSNDYMNNYVKPYVADLGVAMAFGIGFFIFKSLRKKEVKDEKAVKQEIVQKVNKWHSAKSLQKFNNLIVNNSDASISPFQILESIHKAELVPDIMTYNCLIVMGTRLNQDDDVSKLLEDLNDSTSPVQADIVTYNILLKNIIKKIKEQKDKSKLPDAVRKLKLLRKEISMKGLKPDDFTYNTIIDGFVEANELDEALIVYEEMRQNLAFKSKNENNIFDENVTPIIKNEISDNLIDIPKPDIYTYTTLIKGLRNSQNEKNLEKILSIYDMLVAHSKDLNVRIDEFLINSVIDSCAKFGKISEAQRIFNTIEELDVKPSVITFSIILKALGSDGKLEEAMSLFTKMKLMNIKPNEITYDCLLNCAIRVHNLDAMKNIYKMMRDDDITPNSVILSTLVKGFNRTKNHDLAFQLYENLNEKQLKIVDIVFFNSLLDCCVECGNYRKMQQIYNTILQRTEEDKIIGGSFSPTVVTYSTLLKGFTKANCAEKAEELYLQFKNSSDYVDEVFFNTMADFYAKKKEENKVIGVYESMKSSKVIRSSVIYSIMIKMYSQLGNEEKAIEMFSNMKKEGLKSTVITSTTMMQMFIKQKKMDKALDVFYDMKNSGMSVDNVSYNFIINGCSFNKKLEVAIKILLESLDEGTILCQNTYNNVLEYLVNNKFMKYMDRCQYAGEILTKLKEKKIEIKYEVYSKVMKVLYKNQSNSTQNQNQNQNRYNKSYKSNSRGYNYDNNNYGGSVYN